MLPAGVAGLGVPFARGAATGVRVTAAFAREGAAPATVTVDVTPGREAPAEIPALPGGRAGQIEAWEPVAVSLGRVDDSDRAFLEARFADGRVARHPLASPEAVVVPRGAATAAGAAFLVGSSRSGAATRARAWARPAGRACARGG
ncbi:MAG: hypothetical protein U0325_12075 [Polyangiales bacterium]